MKASDVIMAAHGGGHTTQGEEGNRSSLQPSAVVMETTRVCFYEEHTQSFWVLILHPQVASAASPSGT